MKKALISGITGQDGSYLAELLLQKEYRVFGVQRKSSSFNTRRIDHIFDHPQFQTFYGDLLDGSSLRKIIQEVRPDEFYHLGAQSHVRVSFDIPEYTGDTVGLSVIRILDILKEAAPEAKFYQASSSEMFGRVREVPQNEKTPFNPRSPYGCAKVYGFWIAKNYREAYNMFTVNGILFNHESPRRGETFVTRKITRGLSRIKLGKDEKLLLGNLDAKRDWGYAPDYVEAMWLMMQQNKPDDYVVATGETHSVKEFCEKTAALLGLNLIWEGEGINEKGIDYKTNQTIIEINPRFFRPSEVDLLIGDASYAQEKLKWQPKIKFDELVEIMTKSDFEAEKGGNSPKIKCYFNYTFPEKTFPEKKYPKIFVAGGTGFLGKRVIKKLQEKNLNYCEASLSTGVDFRDPKQTENFFARERADVVINCAAYLGGIKFDLNREGKIFYKNTLINLNLIDAARKFEIKRFISPLSNCSYPENIINDFRENEWWNGQLNPSIASYGFTQKISYMQSLAYHNQYGMNFINLIAPNIYGPGDHFEETRSHALGALISKIIRAKKENAEEVVVWGTGRPVREWLYVDDFVQVLLFSLNVLPQIEPINIGNGRGVSIADLARLIRELAGYKGKLIFDTTRPDGAARKVMNVDKMKKIFKWSPPTELKEGVYKTIKWYEKQILK